MQLNDKCYNLVKEYEGLRLTAYQCPAGVWTIGYGHTGKVDGVPVQAGMTISKEKADALLADDLERFRRHVMTYDEIYHWNENELAALVSFAFNIGNIHQLTANGTRTKTQIAEKMLLYTKAAGRELPGLVRRRQAERELFLMPALQPESISLLVNGIPATVRRILQDSNNYVHLRDLCKCLGLNVTWQNGQISIGG